MEERLFVQGAQDPQSSPSRKRRYRVPTAAKRKRMVVEFL
jgi:hypothetical protein